MWFCVESDIVLQLDHSNTGAQCKGNVLGSDKLGIVIAAVASQWCVGLAVALFVALQPLDCGPHRAGAWLPAHSILNDLAFYTVLLGGESECNQGGIVQFHSPCGVLGYCVVPPVEGHVQQAERGVVGAE